MTYAVDDETTLVPLHAGFADAYAALVERDLERFGRRLAWVHTARRADDIRAYVRTVEERRAQDLGDNYAIVVNGEFAGAVDIHDVNRLHGCGAIGYLLGSAFGGRGIMTRAVIVVTRLAFDVHRLHRLELFAAVDNAPSRAVAERAGFVREGVLRERLWSPHGYDDAVLYARLASDVHSPGRVMAADADSHSPMVRSSGA